MKNRVLILFGGNSSEYEVSCGSAASIIEHINKDLFEILVVGITRDNKWLLTEASYEDIKDSFKWIEHPNNKEVVLSTSSNTKGLIVFEENGSIKNETIDVIFPILHGENGEDGSIQGLFQLANIKYIGSDICSSACSMDKVVTNLFVDHLAIKKPKCYSVAPRKYSENMEFYTKEADEFHDSTYPVVVKPSKTGSSVGVNVANDFDELKKYMLVASKYEGKIMVEEFISGREMKVAILGTDEIEFGEICEIVISDKAFNDYETKYKSNGTHKQIPADIKTETAEKLKALSKEIYNELGCKSLARVDFFMTNNDELYFNEINTMPGLTEKSIYSLMLDKAGLKYCDLLTKLINDCIQGK